MDFNDLCGTYSLTHFDGKQTATGGTLCLSRDGDANYLLLSVANTFRGKVNLDGDRLSGALASTRMMGDDDQMRIEDAVSSGFESGFIVRLDGDRLLLKNAESSMIFKRSIKLEDIFGEHAIVSVNGEEQPEEFTIKFVPDGNGGAFVIANIVNSLRGNCQVQGGTLQGNITTTNMSAGKSAGQLEKSVIAGFERGFHFGKNVTGVYLESDEVSMQLCHIITPEVIAGEYLLKLFNGTSVETEQQSLLAFEPTDAENELTVFIIVANRIRGSVTLDKNVLRSDEPLMSTQKDATEEESRLETAYNASFQYGVDVSLVGNILTMSNEENTFVYTKVPSIETSNGSPTYHGTYMGKCFKTEGNGLLFRIVNDIENKWAFYNDTPNYRMHVRATFGARSDITPLDQASMHTDDDGRYVVEVTINPVSTEMFIFGTVNGFKIQYSAEPL